MRIRINQAAPGSRRGRPRNGRGSASSASAATSSPPWIELGLKRQELEALRAPLERCGAIISRSLQVTAGGGHQHSSELARWDQVYPGGGAGQDPAGALRDLVVVSVRAAVLAPEAELRRWFSWPWYWGDTLVDDLVRERRLRRVEDYVIAAG